MKLSLKTVHKVTWQYLPVTFLKVRKVFYLSTRKLLVTKLSWVKGFLVTILSLKWNSQVIKLVFGLALWRALVSFRHDLDGNPGLSAAAHRHQVSFGIIFQAGWFLVCSPLELWVQHHPHVGCADSASTPSPSISPCAPTVSGESSWYLSIYDLLFISACADRMWEEPWNIQDFK